MPVFNNALAGAAGSGGADAGYTIQRSLRFNRSDSAYLSRSPSGGNRKKWTLSFWYKPCLATGGDRHCILEARNSSGHHSVINFRSDHKFEIYHYTTSLHFQVLTTAHFRDPSAWYHFVVAYDTDQSGADKVKIFCNGIRITQFDTASYPSDSYGDALWNDNNILHTIGRTHTHHLNGYLAEYHWLDGIAPGISTDDASGSVTGTPNAQYLTDFGEFDETTGVWNPIEFAGTTQIELPGTVTPTLSNGALIVKGVGGNQASGTITSGGGNLNFFASSNGINWTHVGSGLSHTYGGGDWLAAGGAGTSPRTFTTSGADFQFAAWNTNTNFDQGGGHTTDVTGLTFSDPPTSAFGVNGFHLDFSDNSSDAALGTDSSGNNNTWTVTNILAQGDAGDPFTVLGNVSNSGSSSAINVSSLSTVTSTPATSWPADSNTYNHLTADFQSVGNYSIHADPFLSSPTANIVVFQSDNGTSWTSISSGQSPYSFSGRYIQWVRSGSGYGAQTLTAADTRPDQDSLLDSPTNYEASSGNNGGNYCTLNPLQKSSEVTLSNGNLDVSTSSTSNKCKVFGTMAVTSGKWYYEVTIGSNYRGSFGWATDPNSNLAQQPGDSSGDYALTFDGQKVKSGTYTGSYGTAYSSGMVIGIRLDATAGTVAFSQDGVDKGNAYTGQTDLTWWPIVGDASSGGTFNGSVNFGQRPFAHTPPTGYKSLCTTNLDDPLIDDPSKYFDTKLWTGNGGEQIIGGGIRYSDYVTGTIDSANPATKAFDGITTNTGVRTATASNISITFQPPTPLAFSASFKIWCARDGTNAGNTFVVHHAGGSTDFTSSVTTGTTNTAVDLAQLSGVTSPISKIVVSSGGSNPRFTAIEVDGSMLIDSTADPYNFSPDLLWIKSRNTGAWHVLADNVRGPGKILSTNDPATEDGSAAAQTAIQSFDSNGFTVKHHSSWTVNSDNNPHVGWAWDGGDLVTNSAYNQSAVWSNSTVSGTLDSSYPLSNTFNGSISGANTRSSGANTTITITLPQAVSFSSQVRLRVNANGTAKINNESTVSTSSGGVNWVTVYSGSGSLASVTLTSTGGDTVSLYAIEVDGKMLVDAGVIPVGSLNSSTYNQDQQWTNGWSGQSGTSGRVPTNGFNGDLSNWAFAGNNNANEYVEYSFTAIDVNTSLEFYLSFDAGGSQRGQLWVNDTNVTSQLGAGNAQWYTVTGQSTLSKIKILTTATNYYVNLHAVRVDGKILVDDNITPPSVPSIPSTVRTNQTSGCSIVTYTGNATGGSTVGHNLNKKPDLIFLKARTSQQNWLVYHSSKGASYHSDLNLSGGFNSGASKWTSTEPTSSVFSVATDGAINGSNVNYVAYCFTSVKGFSAFGSYTSSTPFVYTGFRPAYVIIKSTSGGRNWIVLDSARDPYNRTDRALLANDPSIEDDNSTYSVDFLSNGFKVRGSNGQITGDSEYVYLAFAQNPFKTARAR